MEKPKPPQSRSTSNNKPEAYTSKIAIKMQQMAKASGKSLEHLAKDLGKNSL
jgi:hypothetical protein